MKKGSLLFGIVSALVLAVIVFCVVRYKNKSVQGYAEDMEKAELHAKRFAAFLDLMNIDISDFGVNDWKKYVEYTKIPLKYLIECYKRFGGANWKGSSQERFKLMLALYYNYTSLR